MLDDLFKPKPKPAARDPFANVVPKSRAADTPAAVSRVGAADASSSGGDAFFGSRQAGADLSGIMFPEAAAAASARTAKPDVRAPARPSEPASRSLDYSADFDSEFGEAPAGVAVAPVSSWASSKPAVRRSDDTGVVAPTSSAVSAEPPLVSSSTTAVLRAPALLASSSSDAVRRLEDELRTLTSRHAEELASVKQEYETKLRMVCLLRRANARCLGCMRVVAAGASPRVGA